MDRFLVLAQSAAAQRREGMPIGVFALVGAWFLFGLVGWLLIWRAPTAERKRRIHRRFIIAAGIVMSGFLCASVAGGFPPQVLIIMGPAIILVTWVNLRFTTFCDSCNRMIYNQFWFRRIRFCPHCGAQLSKPA